MPSTKATTGERPCKWPLCTHTHTHSAQDACPARHGHTQTLVTYKLSPYTFLPPTHTYLQDPQPRQVCDFHPLSFRWRAGNHSAFWGMTLDEGIRYRLGTIRPSSSVTNMNEIHVIPSNAAISLRSRIPGTLTSCALGLGPIPFQ